jgi:hypothetical protein
MPRSFTAKFTLGGGPLPEEELARILEQANNSPNREAWFGTRKAGVEWHGPGICVLLAVPKRRNRRGARQRPPWEALIAEVVERSDAMPNDTSVKELYEGHEGFNAWWQVRNPIAVQYDALDAVSGCGVKSRKNAADVLGGSVSFAYWDFGNSSFDDLAVAAVPKLKALPQSGSAVRADTPTEAPTIQKGSAECWKLPSVPLFGVDFSGGEEDPRHGDRKIWVAEWPPGQGITLRCGWCADPAGKICRRDLPKLIAGKPGWWSLDFPFGVAKETAVALKLNPNSWGEWLGWCAQGGDATERRDTARNLTAAAGVPWATRRRVDIEHHTTWFPLFEQLYRQTIYGAREVLSPLYADQQVCILPWRYNVLPEPRTETLVVVVEGFPGATVATGLLERPRVSYKGRTNAHRIERQNIVEALTSAPFCLPIADEIAQEAVEDEDGDALDALVLLVGSWVAMRLRIDEWQQHCETLRQDNALVEGWFPVRCARSADGTWQRRQSYPAHNRI